MSIHGSITLEDTSIVFRAQDLTVKYTVKDSVTNECETRTVPQAAFFAALSIAVHSDGEPDAERDYPLAESVQPSNKRLRWIP